MWLWKSILKGEAQYNMRPVTGRIKSESQSSIYREMSWARLNDWESVKRGGKIVQSRRNSTYKGLIIRNNMKCIQDWKKFRISERMGSRIDVKLDSSLDCRTRLLWRTLCVKNLPLFFDQWEDIWFPFHDE